MIFSRANEPSCCPSWAGIILSFDFKWISKDAPRGRCIFVLLRQKAQVWTPASPCKGTWEAGCRERLEFLKNCCQFPILWPTVFPDLENSSGAEHMFGVARGCQVQSLALPVKGSWVERDVKDQSLWRWGAAIRQRRWHWSRWTSGLVWYKANCLCLYDYLL